MVEYNNDGQYIQTIWMPEKAVYGYDVRIQPRLNRMLTSSFTGQKNYMRNLGELIKDPEAMKNFGNTMVLWDAHARKPLQIFEVPGAPLEVRWALQPKHDYAFTTTALTSKIWLIERKTTERSRRKRSLTSAIPARSHCRSTSACRSTTTTSSSTRSWTARCESTTSPTRITRSSRTSRRSARS